MDNNITEIRETKGLSQAELARRLGFTRSYMNKVERGKTTINLKLGLRICEQLNCTLNDIFLP